MKKSLKLFSVAVALFIVFTGIGYYAVKSSAYMDVSQVLKLDHQAKVTIRGYLAGVAYDKDVVSLLLVDHKCPRVEVTSLPGSLLSSYGPKRVLLEGTYYPDTHILRVISVAMPGQVSPGVHVLSVSQLLRLKHEEDVIVQGYLIVANSPTAFASTRAVLLDENCPMLRAEAPTKYIRDKYGPVQYIQWDPDNVVLQGVYDPQNRVLVVTDILEGCHSNYGQPAART